MKNVERRLKNFVTENVVTVLKLIDETESFIKEFEPYLNSSESSIPLIKPLHEMTMIMDYCDKLLKKTLESMLTAELDIEGEDMDECFEMYNNAFKRYTILKETVYNIILNTNRLNEIFADLI